MPERILRWRDVIPLTGLGRSTIYDLISREEFPRPMKLGPRAVGWPEKDIQAWIVSRCRTVR
ncbi:MAG: AlpA family transcriptional regulator [Rhodobacteraceae bacterium]|nr:AlpA family transcriptional regulator [Paracoccaceae bacterium]